MRSLPTGSIIQQVQNLLLHGAGAHQIEHALIRQVHDLDDLAPNLFSDFRLPLAELLVQVFCENIHSRAPRIACALGSATLLGGERPNREMIGSTTRVASAEAGAKLDFRFAGYGGQA
jgi:hypothetical protein